MPSSWSSPSLVTSERREMAQWPEFHASHDSVWALYTCHDDDAYQECDSQSVGEETDCDWEVWSQNRYAIPDAVPNGQTMTWNGQVYLDADFLVPAGSTLHIEPGTEVFVNSTDARNQGIDMGRIEIIIRGHLIAPGTAAFPVTVAGKTGTGAGEWYGFRFDGAPIAGSSTSLDYVSIRNSFRAVTVDTLGFRLYECTFGQNQEADIYLDRDFRIPEGKDWTLRAPMKVLVKNTDAAPKSWGKSQTKCEILVEGALRSYRPTGASPSDTVRFVATAMGSNGWTGITIVDGATGSIYDAAIGSATNPIEFLAAAYARVWNSRIYDLGTAGIVDWASNAWIKGCKLTKAVGASSERRGIHLTASTGRVESNTVGYMEKWGIRAEFNASYCNSPVAADTLVISGNTLTGNGGTAPGSSQGISVSRGCDHRHPRIRNNTITQWSGYGLDLSQCAETRIHNNTINDNNNGLQYVRNSNAAGDVVRLYRNDFLANDARNVHSTESYSLTFREPVMPDSVGNNRFRQKTTNTTNFEATDPLSVIDAQRNLWMRLDESIILEPDTTEIRQTFIENPTGRVTIARVLTSGGGPEALQAPSEIGLPSEPQEPSTSGGDALGPTPVAFQISAIHPNPFTGSVTIRYDVPSGEGREMSLVVYDVSGRVVQRLVGEARKPGRHEVVWDGRARGRTISSGIYFVRLEAGDFRQTKKLVALRAGGGQ